MTTPDTRGGIGHLLHHIRASVQELRSMVSIDSQEFVEVRLAKLLARSDIAGCFPRFAASACRPCRR